MNDLAQITFGKRGTVWLVVVRGEIDMSNAQQVAEEMRASIPNQAEAVVLDLSQTAYLDSRGISLLFQLARRLNMRGQRLALAVPKQAPIRSVLDLTGVGAVAEIYPSVGEAESQVLVLDH